MTKAQDIVDEFEAVFKGVLASLYNETEDEQNPEHIGKAADVAVQLIESKDRAGIWADGEVQDRDG